ncbi:iron chelate uptake ABC transporter family permease subunit [Devosia ginsengisoli]|uniref:Iron chelate uptake ABC transporter family permease subunit n=1 Tax=Devosia ginsengisoli TaxID=400770 RepID=A0A5B8LZT0_9HYPH|nr:iron chelate uptake ABC transporter family permease subunit [Devosia ginsengisoli]QDZ13045.1 iron chelate uptake ABC transporter family permease subunit [Devosia ginsengisoli]
MSLTATSQDLARQDARRPGVAQSNATRLAWLLLAIAVLVAVLVASIAVGSKDIPVSTVLDALFAYDDSDDHAIVQALRVPRTLMGLAVGAALGMAGALIQALTRNPLADPGILGVNAGAAFFVVLAVGLFGLTSIQSYIWFAFLGAIVTTVLVYAVGSAGRGGATPVRLTLAGVAIGAVLSGISSGITLLNPSIFDRMRQWGAGSLVAPGYETLWAVLPFIGIGLVIAILVARPLNAVALGDDLAAALGANMVRTRALVVVATTLLAGAATAAAGPIGFVGLMVPHVARWIVGPDQRWIFLFTVVLAPILLLTSDIVGRVVMRPGELQVGIVTAFVGAPVLILLARRRRVSGL